MGTFGRLFQPVSTTSWMFVSLQTSLHSVWELSFRAAGLYQYSDIPEERNVLKIAGETLLP